MLIKQGTMICILEEQKKNLGTTLIKPSHPKRHWSVGETAPWCCDICITTWLSSIQVKSRLSGKPIHLHCPFTLFHLLFDFSCTFFLVPPFSSVLFSPSLCHPPFLQKKQTRLFPSFGEGCLWSRACVSLILALPTLAPVLFPVAVYLMAADMSSLCICWLTACRLCLLCSEAGPGPFLPFWCRVQGPMVNGHIDAFGWSESNWVSDSRWPGNWHL
jgi:hypothetical protein